MPETTKEPYKIRGNNEAARSLVGATHSQLAYGRSYGEKEIVKEIIKLEAGWITTRVIFLTMND